MEEQEAKELATRIMSDLPTFVPKTDAEAQMMILLTSPGYVSHGLALTPVSACSRGRGMIAIVDDAEGNRFRIQVDKVVKT